MADKKITQLTQVSTLPDEAVFTAVDSTRTAGDQNVKITKANLSNDLGGGADLTKDVTQVAHGFSVGSVVRLDGSTYVAAQADAEANANAISIVIAVADVDNFTIQSESYTSAALGLSNGDEAWLSTTVAGGIQTSEPTEGEINVFLGQQTPQGFLINIQQGFLVTSGGGSSQPVSKTGTTIEFTEDALYNEATYLTTGDLTLDLTGAVKGVVSVVYCDEYIPSITGTNFISSGSPDADALNIYSFFYDGTNVYLNIGNVITLNSIEVSITPGDTELVLNWAVVENADNYVIERALDSGFTSGLTEVYNGGLLTYTDTGLTNGTTYYYRGKSQGSGFFESDFGATASDAPEVGFDYTIDLVAAYQFENNVNDFTGNHNGTAAGSPGYAAGVVGNSIILDTTAKYVQVSDADDFTMPSALSICYWVRFTTVTINNNWILSKRDGSNIEYLSGYNELDDRFRFLIYTDTSNWLEARVESFVPTVNTWYHIVFTFDGVNGNQKLYINAVDNSTTNSLGTYTGMTNTSAPVYLGANGSAPTTDPLIGDLDEIKFYKGRVLTPAEITNMYNEELLGNSVL